MELYHINWMVVNNVVVNILFSHNWMVVNNVVVNMLFHLSKMSKTCWPVTKCHFNVNFSSCGQTSGAEKQWRGSGPGNLYILYMIVIIIIIIIYYTYYIFER